MAVKSLVPLTYEEHARVAFSVIKGLEVMNVSESEMIAVLKTAAELIRIRSMLNPINTPTSV